MTAEFKRAVAEVEEGEWKPLEREVNGQRVKTGQEWAEVCRLRQLVGGTEVQSKGVEIVSGSEYPFC